MTFAGQLLIEVLVALGIAVCDARPGWRIGASVAALATLAALAVTFTRSAWIGLFVGVAVIAGATWPLALVALVVVAIAAVAFAPGAWRARLASIVDPNHPWNQQRVHMWHAGLRMFRDHPLTGVGLQDLKPIYERYKEPGATEPAGHLHDVFVQILATMGAIGLAAFLWLYSALVWMAAAGLRPMLRRRGFAAGVRLGVLAALAGFIVAGLFEWNFGDEELLYPLYTLVGLAFAARSWEAADPPEGA
jgi:O-antigen ligase